MNNKGLLNTELKIIIIISGAGRDWGQHHVEVGNTLGGVDSVQKSFHCVSFFLCVIWVYFTNCHFMYSEQTYLWRGSATKVPILGLGWYNRSNGQSNNG